MKKQRKLKARKKPACAIRKVWGYPATEDNEGPVHWAWSCACGAGGVSLKTEEKAREQAAEHWSPQG